MTSLCTACQKLLVSQRGSWGRFFLAACAVNLQNRNFTMSSMRPTSKGPIAVREEETNLQKRKHFKYSDEFIRKQVDRFKLGKRRLANMMGDDPDSYTEDDVKRAIRYLFPSDLDEDSAPSMQHPVKVYSNRLKICWDATGRPDHYLYYTTKQNANDLLHQIYQHVLDVRDISSVPPGQDNQLDLTGTRWMTKEELSKDMLGDEIIRMSMYRQILAQFERLLEEENAYMARDFIMKYRKTIPIVSTLDGVKEPAPMDDGRSCVTEEGRKKTAFSEVTLLYPGTGKITVNGEKFLNYFDSIDDRQTVLSPFCFLGILGRFDVEAKVEGGLKYGPVWHAPDPPDSENGGFRKASQAQSIRHAIARALRSFLPKEDSEMMRRAGLLTLDKRWKERKLPGQHKARKKHTWKKR